MKYRIVVLSRARRDVDVTYQWIAERSPEGARRWYLAYRSALQKSAKTPESYGLADEDDEVPDRTLRQFLFKTRRGRTFRGIFTVEGDEVRVLRIRGADQAPLTPDDFPF